MKQKFLIILTTIVIGLSGLVGLKTVHAQIEIDVEREFTLSKEGVMQVREKETIKNTFQDRYVPGGAQREYFFVISSDDQQQRGEVLQKIHDTLSVKLNGRDVEYSRLQRNGLNGISYNLVSRLYPNSSQVVEISYQHPELGEKYGGVVDAYIPAFSENFQFQLDNTSYTYRTKLKIPTTSGQENIVSVTPLNKYTEGDYDVYIFDQESLRGSYVWVQRGSKQIYKFKMTQDLVNDDSGVGSLEEYKLVIPRDIDEVNVTQEVYYTQITPEPYYIEETKEGNLLASFRVNSKEYNQIIIEGYAELKKASNKLENAGTLEDLQADIAGISVSEYLQPAEYWEVNAPAIQKAALAEAGGENEIYKLVSNVYKSTVDSIDYSEVKKFGINQRQGALSTLEGGAAVCMEYSDLYLTKLRALGVPARAAFGYGYDSKLGNDSQEAHQWVQVYFPKFQKWVSVDVTWGESGVDILGGDLNHFYTHVAYEDPNTPSVLTRLSLNQSGEELSSPRYELEVVDALPLSADNSDDNADINLMTSDDLKTKYGQEETGASSDNYYLAALLNKYVASFYSLFTDPARIDSQGWIMILGTFAIILGVFIAVVRLILRDRSKNPEAQKHKL